MQTHTHNLKIQQQTYKRKPQEQSVWKSHFQNRHKDSDREMAISTHITLIVHLRLNTRTCSCSCVPTAQTQPPANLHRNALGVHRCEIRLKSKHASHRHVPDEFHQTFTSRDCRFKRMKNVQNIDLYVHLFIRMAQTTWQHALANLGVVYTTLFSTKN